MAVATETSAAPVAHRPSTMPWPRWIGAIRSGVPTFLWGVASIGLFAGIWEVLWAIGWADARLLPPPHIFLGAIADQAKFFNTVNRWQIGAGQGGATSPPLAVFYTVL